jgi:hypothetical protein
MQFWIERGYTFTDVVGQRRTGRSPPTNCSRKTCAAITANPPSSIPKGQTSLTTNLHSEEDRYRQQRAT